MSEDLSGFSLIELFRAEAESQTALLADGILALERGETASPATLEALMRAAHSLKGAARIVGLDAATRVAHVLEDYFVAAQKGKIAVAQAHADVLLNGVDLLNQIAQLSAEESASWLTENEPRIAGYVERLQAILSGDTSALPPAPAAIPPSPPPPPNPPVVAVQPSNIEAKPAVAEAAAPAKPPPQPEPAKTPTTAPAAEKTERVVRVTADSLTRLLGLAGESLVESRQFRPFLGALQQIKQEQSALLENLRTLEEHLANNDNGAEVVHDLLGRAREQSQRCHLLLNERVRELDDLAHRGEDLAGRLHHEIVASRMRPLADGVRGFPRMVRDVARQLGKSVNFEIIGEEVGVDRDVLEKLEAPLNHLLRNALDHGLEMPEERTAAGKAAVGQVRLEACHRAGLLQLTLRDDGRGIDPNRIRAKVLERGLVSAAMAAQLSEAELFEFLFLPGFTTKASVTELSGRGVGLDVVQNMVKNLGGSVRVTSVLGRETCFILRLPITMSVIRALLVQINGEPYAFPLTRIERIEVVDRGRIQWLEGRQYFTLEQQSVGLVEAAQVLDLSDASRERKRPEDADSLAVVVIGDRGHYFGLIVDRFLGERDLDVRPLDPRLGKVPNLGGASILEDGGPVLIFDVEDLLHSIDGLLTGRRLRWTLPQEAAGQLRAAKRILVVDDSITVRALERQLLENHGYAVDIAQDGMDGWNTIRSGTYDLVVSDVDMPRMDGIELVRRIRQEPRLKSVPVVIVSYKDREEDRLRGLDAGANCYLTKSSFHDATFIKAIIDLIGEA